MNDRDYELLSQYIDSELESDQAQDLRQRLMAEPDLRAAHDKMRMADNKVRQAFEGSWAEQVPDRITNLLTRDRAGSEQRRSVWGMAIAASVLATAGLLLNPEWRADDSGDVALAAVLDGTPSGGIEWQALADGRQIQPVLSFAHVDGTWCREYLLSEDGATFRGVACRSAGQWITGILEAQALPGNTSEYRPAGADDVDAVAAYISDHGASIALSRTEEAELINRQWQ